MGQSGLAKIAHDPHSQFLYGAQRFQNGGKGVEGKMAPTDAIPISAPRTCPHLQGSILLLQRDQLLISAPLQGASAEGVSELRPNRTGG